MLRKDRSRGPQRLWMAGMLAQTEMVRVSPHPFYLHLQPLTPLHRAPTYPVNLFHLRAVMAKSMVLPINRGPLPIAIPPPATHHYARLCSCSPLTTNLPWTLSSQMHSRYYLHHPRFLPQFAPCYHHIPLPRFPLPLSCLRKPASNAPLGK